MSIYLLRRGATLQSAFSPSSSFTEHKTSNPSVRIVSFAGQPRTPSWVKYLAPALDQSQSQAQLDTLETLESVSPRAALALEVKGRIFVVPFGTANYYMINEALVESNFGLRVALNYVGSSELRSIDSKTIDGVVLDTRRQSSKATSKSSFRLDEDRDLLRMVVGLASHGVLESRQVVGRDALRSSLPGTIQDLPGHCEELLEMYGKDYYRKSGFDFVDRICQVRDPALIAKLESQLQADVRGDKHSSVVLSPPEIIDWSAVEGFRFKGSRNSTPELSLEDFLCHLKNRNEEFDVTSALTEKVALVDATGERTRSWPIYKCITADVAISDAPDKIYVLNEGNWYEIDQDFADELNQFIGALTVQSVNLPEWDGGHEKNYNNAAASGGQFINFDRKLLRPKGASKHSRIEVCDLYCPTGKFIHVKNGKDSSALSHLFAQGTVSAELIMDDEDFRKQFRNRLGKASKKPIPHKRKPKGEDLTVVYAILRNDDKDPWPVCLPFFSKINLRSHVRKLEARNINVVVQRVPKLATSSTAVRTTTAAAPSALKTAVGPTASQKTRNRRKSVPRAV